MKVALRVAVALVAAVGALTLGEGFRTIVLRGTAHTSLTYETYLRMRAAQPDAAPSTGAVPHPDPRTVFLSSRGEFDELVPAFKGIDAGIGNTGFYGLITENASVNVEDGDCTRMKANVNKRMVQLRSQIFNVYNPPLAFFDRNRSIPKPIADFLTRYSFRETILTSNADGERVTLPVVSTREKVLVAGDSVALGVLVNDDETLASRLQAADGSRQYVNLGISGVGPRQIACALERAAARYPREISAVIYVFCDNDYEPSDPRASPAAIIRWLEAFRSRNAITHVTVVRAPYLETLFPIDPETGVDFSVNGLVAELSRLSRAAGFTYLDITNLALEEAMQNGTLFGAFRMFVDHAHLSPFGIEKLAAALR